MIVPDVSLLEEVNHWAEKLPFDSLAAGGVDFFSSNTLIDIPERMDMAAIALGCVIEAFFLTNLFRRWTHDEISIFEGFQFGVWIGLFLGFGTGMVSYGTYEMHTLNVHLVDAAWSVVFYGLTGLIIAWSFRLMRE